MKTIASHANLSSLKIFILNDTEYNIKETTQGWIKDFKKVGLVHGDGMGIGGQTSYE